MRTKKVLIADRDPLFIKGLIVLINENIPELNVECTENTLCGLIDRLKNQRFDLVIFSSNLEDYREINLKKLKISANKAYFLFIIKASITNRLQDFQAMGMNGFIMREWNEDDYLSSIRLVLQNGYVYNNIPQTNTNQVSEINGHYHECHGKIELTEKQKEVLTLLSKGWNCKQIAKELFLSPRTIENHVNNMKQKLEAHNNVQLVGKAYKLRILKI